MHLRNHVPPPLIARARAYLTAALALLEAPLREALIARTVALAAACRNENDGHAQAALARADAAAIGLAHMVAATEIALQEPLFNGLLDRRIGD